MAETETKDPNIREYHNHKIHLNEQNWEFTVTGPEFDNQEYCIAFDSYKAARVEIDKRVSDTTRLKARNIKLNLILLDEKGETVNVTRINRRTGEIDCDTRYLYPNVPWVREALRRWELGRAEARQIEDSVRSLRIERSRSYSHIDTDHYERYIEDLHKSVAEKTKLATEREIPKEVETEAETA